MSPRVLALLCCLFFASGACALIYQVMWLRLLALVFGVTVYAASTVLASFMSGLALGSFAAGRLAGRLRSPLAAFGFVEIAIGMTAAATPFVFEALREAWVALAPTLPASAAFVTAARFLSAFAVLIVPTTLMGSTLPLVVKSALGRSERSGSRMALLYAVNTAGAIAGAGVAGFYLISHIGVGTSFRIAAALNVLVGAAALLASRFVEVPAVEPLPGGSATPIADRPATLSDTQRRIVLWVFAASGFMSLALEVIWFRILVIMLRPTACAFTIMLASVLVGITAGSAVATPLLARRVRWLPALALLQLGIALAAALSFNTLARADALQAFSGPLLTGLGLDAYLAPLIATSFAAMLPTTLLLGAAFPIGLALWTGAAGSEEATRRVGTFYSLNLCGAIAGSLAGGFVLLPLIGSHASVLTVAALALASSVALALSCWPQLPNFAGFTALVGPVAFLMVCLNTVDPFAGPLSGVGQRERVVWRDEGVQTTVAVHDRRESRRTTRIMYVDGMHQANDSPQTAFVHHRIGALPMMLHERPARALVVGLGGGATAGAAARFSGVRVDVVELSPEVVRGAEYFKAINFDLLARPGVQVRVDDGRNHLMVTRERYDVITADIILPRHAGAGSLYSYEYFQLVRRALDRGGLAVQWIGSEGETEYKLIMRTFLAVFPHTTLWGDGSLMIGSVEPLTISCARFEERRRAPGFSDLFDWDVQTMKRLYLAGPGELAAFVGPGPILTDDRPVIEYFLSLPKNDPPVNLRALAGSADDIFRP